MPIRIPPRESAFERAHRPANPGLFGPLPQDAPAPATGGLTYEPFYRLKAKPFSLTADASFFFHSQSHAPAFDNLVEAIRRRESLNVLSGDIGTGKTTLCRAVLESLDRKTFSAFVPDPFASREDLLKVLLVDFGVASVDDLASGRLRDASRTELSYLLYEFMGTLEPLQAFAVVFIDEAQNLSVPLLEEIRILSDADGQLQVVLVGQLELRQKLKLPEMRQVDQRISVHCTLDPLGSDDVAGYIAHRLQTAGGSPDRVRFSAEAADAIFHASGGVPRVINRLCDRALQQGFLRRACTIDREIVEAVLPEAAPVQAPESPPAVVAPEPAPRGDAVDEWLTTVDWPAVAPTETLGLSAFAEEPVRPEPGASPDPYVSTPAEPSPSVRRGFLSKKHVQRTHMERVTLRWTRRLANASLVLTVVLVGLMGWPAIITVSSDVWTRATDVFDAGAAPDMPPPPARPVPVLKMPPPPDPLIEEDVPAVGRQPRPLPFDRAPQKPVR